MLALARPPLSLPAGLAQPRLTSAPPEGDAWVHEVKFDGYRILARVENQRVRLVTRPGNDWTSRAPGVVEALAKLGARGTLMDGEAVLLHPDGRPNFFGLRVRLPRARAYAISYVAFDLLYLEGEDVRGRNLLERRRALRELVRPTRDAPHLSVSEVFENSGSAVYEAACRLGAEGLVSKLRTSKYRAGRTGDWLKVLNPAYRRR
jgi:bifunctional non-homologous end joining protein LigD